MEPGQGDEIVTQAAGPAGPIAQRTLKAAIRCSGIGLHGGRPVTMVIKPGMVNGGVHFVRTDAPEGSQIIPATWDRVVDTRLCTVLGNDRGWTVGTVEHVMAALHGCGIDNAVIELDGPEVPIMDGSAEPFVFLIECAGVVSQAATRRYIRVLRPITVEDAGPRGRRAATLAPADRSSFEVEIDFDSPVVAQQRGQITLVNGAFKGEVARARTFGFLREVDMLRRNGLALGGSLENAIVVHEDRVLNPEGLRYSDEFVRHKLLDSIGDLYLAGAPLLGAFHGVKSGHHLNNQLLRALFADRTAWIYDTVGMESGGGTVPAVAAAGRSRRPEPVLLARSA